ncbi:MAG TPA: isoprenylcysteine carboxylmethyltransferase family protein [Verrucomicrobiae bacterium]|nr:isoprenylcysteine carboxylmethyltransferase family protein [Verrucomicrobiae bacterium]
MIFYLMVWCIFILSWAVWAYVPIFRAPHNQKRASITAKRPTWIGITLELASYSVATSFIQPSKPGLPRLLAAAVAAPLGAAVMWTAVAHLGRQFRINAGLYSDHELVRTGPYAVIRHPIYASMLLLLVATTMLVTQPMWMPVAFALFFAGTEVRVRTEDRLLASRFGDQFAAYRRAVSAYIPLVR